VVVKVVRPGVAGAVAADLALLRGIGPLLLRRAGDEFGARMLLPVLDALAEQLGEELDLRNEARAMELVAGLLDPVHLPDVVVPEVHADLSGDKVLTMTFLDGVPIDDPSAIEALGHDPTPRVEQIVRAWFLTLLRHGVFHGDVHAGNLLLLRDGRVGLIDWGIVGRLGADTHRAVRSMIGAALGDPVAMEELVDDMIATFGGLFEVEVDRDLVRALVADVVGGLLTKPFGEVQLSTMLVPPTEHHAAITGREAPAQPSVAGLDAQAESFDRHMFLVAKQLLYFERYGKQYLSEVPLLHDEAFFWSLLEQDTAR
jgi:predicted unusual protein kinase regulating ubiquinone biosynthesis (AarF/ABC1/UbiB family)